MITEIVDTYLNRWVERDLNSIPGDVPSNMQTGQIEDDWVYWKPIESTVTDDELEDIQNTLGARFPGSYKTLLRHKHFIELNIAQVSFIAHPTFSWRLEITKTVFESWPRELLIDKGFLPFASYSDWGMWCFGVNEFDENGECPVYLWDHESNDHHDYVARTLIDALNKEITDADMPILD